MFTGLIREIGSVAGMERRASLIRLRLRAPETVAAGLKLGDSVAVNGICLTVVELAATGFAVEAVPETAARSTLAGWRPGEQVNLELGLAWGDRLDGHLVMGHVDGIASVQAVVPEGGSRRIRLQAPADAWPYLARKGSVALDGVSLTIADVAPPDVFEIALIPHTLERTTLGELAAGRLVNLEVDILARYVHRLHAGCLPDSGLTWERLRSAGF